MAGSPKKRAAREAGERLSDEPRPPHGGAKPAGDPAWDEARKRAGERSKQLALEKKELRRVAGLAREEAFQDALTQLMPTVLEQNETINEALSSLLEQVAAGDFDKDQVGLLNTLLKERQQWVDRRYGKSVGREKRESTRTVVDVAGLLSAARDAAQLQPGVGGLAGLEAGDVVDVEVLEEESGE